jgi:2-polyprenyl-3-methyl-5-hydroxy-6-metoxy-1,4-benzoquinol methylase
MAEPTLQRIAGHFDRLAPFYDANPLYQIAGRAEMAAVRQLLPPEPCQVLDYGCGTGRFSLPLARQGYEVTGFDIAGRMVAQARAKATQWGVQAFFTDDANAIAGRRWPLVLCLGVLDYYREPAALLHQVAPRVAPGGRLIIGAPNLYSPLSWGHALIRLFSLRMHLFRAAQIIAAARGFGLQSLRTLYAFPAVPLLGMTVVIAFEQVAEPSGHQPSDDETR